MREEPLRPLPRWADLCQCRFLLPGRDSYSRRFLQNAKTRWPRAAPRPHHRRLLAISSAARPPSPSAPRRSPLREFADSLSRRTTESQHQNGVLLPRAISLPILTALCSCFASADRIRLRPRWRIITDSTSPSLLGVVCSSDTLIDRRVCSVYFSVKEKTPIASAVRLAQQM